MAVVSDARMILLTTLIVGTFFVVGLAAYYRYMSVIEATAAAAAET